METIFKNSENSKTGEPHRFRLGLTDKLKLKDVKKDISFSQFEYLLHLEKHKIWVQQQ